MELTTKQNEAILSKARYKVYNWGRRSGKTTLFAYEALGEALTKDNAKIAYYAQTYGDARDIAWDIFLEAFGDSVIKKNETLLEITVRNLHNGTSKVSLRGWESVVTSNKGRGMEFDLLLVDEVAFCRGFAHFWDTVLDPTLLTSKGRAVFGSTPNGFNDFYDLSRTAELNGSGEWFYSHATSYDNKHNDPEWLDNKKKEIPEDRFSQEYMADFRRQEGLIYKEFDRAYHLWDGVKEIDDADYLAGIDFGFVHPTAVISIKKDKQGHYWVTDELYKSGLTDAQIAEYVAAKGYTKVYPDPAQPQGIKELTNLGVNCAEVIKGQDSVRNGINKIRELLKQRRIHINVACSNLIYEFETYAYKENSEDPVKEGDDAMDALRYVIMMNETVRRPILDRTPIRMSERKKVNPAR